LNRTKKKGLKGAARERKPTEKGEISEEVQKRGEGGGPDSHKKTFNQMDWGEGGWLRGTVLDGPFNRKRQPRGRVDARIQSSRDKRVAEGGSLPGRQNAMGFRNKCPGGKKKVNNPN